MKATKISRICKVMDGKLLQGDSELMINVVSTDTRQLKGGELFFALRGQRYDGHNFINQAFQSGVKGIVIDKVRANLPPKVAIIQVDNALKALQRLASYNRSLFNISIIGITGSNGKTTTKDMVASLLERKFRTLKTPGNLNNEIGLSLTLLELNKEHEVAVLEMAMRKPGEIDFLCQLARPTAAVITSIGETHLELLGSVDNIARAKGEILDHIPLSGFAVLNKESPFIDREAKRCRGKVIFYGNSPPAEVFATSLQLNARSSKFTANFGNNEIEIKLPVPGLHNVQNALAATGVGWMLGISPAEIAAGLASVSLTGMRLEIIEASGLTIINDAYNANPTSTKAALEILQSNATGKRAIAVLGDMLELGSRIESGHLEVGRAAAKAGINYLVAVGKHAQKIIEGAKEADFPAANASCCAGNKEAYALLKEIIQPGDVILIKGSRELYLEKIVEGLRGETRGRFPCLPYD